MATRSYSDRTLKLLWGRSGGRCAFPNCRIELFADASDYDPITVIGEIAHIAAAQDRGPRADIALAVMDRNAYENLVLLCQNCHALIDGQPGAYTVERLQEIKAAHEAWVRASLPERGRSLTGWTALCLQGDHAIDAGTAEAALSPDFVAGKLQRLQLPSDPPDWNEVDRLIAARVTGLLAAGDPFEFRLAVLPLAPVSACISLGYHLTNRPHVRPFQYHRDERAWVWPRRPAPAQDIAVTGLDAGDAAVREVSFLFHLSAAIADAALENVLPAGPRIDILVPAPSTAWLQHPDQVKWSAIEARQAFERAVQLFPNAERWHLFYAGPAPVAVAIGQQINPTMFPRVQLYEYRHKAAPSYRASICLGEDR